MTPRGARADQLMFSESSAQSAMGLGTLHQRTATLTGPHKLQRGFHACPRLFPLQYLIRCDRAFSCIELVPHVRFIGLVI
jgi:hypothetical protein